VDFQAALADESFDFEEVPSHLARHNLIIYTSTRIGFRTTSLTFKFNISTFIAFNTPVDLVSTTNITFTTTSNTGSPDDYAASQTQFRSPIQS
jgi:hypothetical protein